MISCSFFVGMRSKDGKQGKRQRGRRPTVGVLFSFYICILWKQHQPNTRVAPIKVFEPNPTEPILISKNRYRTNTEPMPIYTCIHYRVATRIFKPLVGSVRCTLIGYQSHTPDQIRSRTMIPHHPIPISRSNPDLIPIIPYIQV